MEEDAELFEGSGLERFAIKKGKKKKRKSQQRPSVTSLQLLFHISAH